MTNVSGSDYRQAVVSGAYASALLDYLRAQGLDPAALYAGHPSLLEPIRSRGQTRLGDWMTLFEIGAAALDDPDLALKAGVHVNVRHMGVLGQVLLNCSTMHEAATQLGRYVRLLGEFGQMRVDIRQDFAHVSWSWPYREAPPAALVQFTQASHVAMTRWLTNRTDLRCDAHFFFPAPRELSNYRRIFGGRLRFGEPVNQLVVPRESLDLPIVLADPALRQRAERDAQTLLQQRAGDSEFLRRLQSSLGQRLQLGRASLDEAAADLGLHARALQRRLEADGTSFRRVLDEVRLAHAQRYLDDPALRLADIAFLLGYAEQSAFQYAFKQWTGLTPGQYRRRRSD